MITITPAAAEQIRASAAEGNMQGLALRIAARRDPDGSIHYGLGFDDNRLDGDHRLRSEDIDIVIGESSQILVDGMTVDYVEIEPGSWQLIFLNPNDVNYRPPAK
ncbi:MAG TPA: iron-sulfur cluster assembly accessory protein [Gammaproteobacteria bacterium]|nr:iron-sulfur cluster assembly accessory protein [Gammaproteobacteria bacterium]